MQINGKLPLQFLNNPSPNQVQLQQAGNTSQSSASNPIAAVNPASQTQTAQHVQGNGGTESGQAQGTTNSAAASKLNIFA